MVTKKIGTVNGYVRSAAWIGNKSFEFDGTIKGLTISAIANGAVAGTTVMANFGGRVRGFARPYIIEATPHDTRANGFWAVNNF